MKPSKRRVVFVPDDYRKECHLGWELDGKIDLDIGRQPSGPGQVWFMDSDDVVTLPPPASAS